MACSRWQRERADRSTTPVPMKEVSIDPRPEMKEHRACVRRRAVVRPQTGHNHTGRTRNIHILRSLKLVQSVNHTAQSVDISVINNFCQTDSPSAVRNQFFDRSQKFNHVYLQLLVIINILHTCTCICSHLVIRSVHTCLKEVASCVQTSNNSLLTEL